MSAFLCSETHLSTLAFELACRDLADNDNDVRVTERDILKSLLRTNLDSLKARYPDSDDSDDLGYKFNPEKGLPPIQVYKLAACYEYQSCEHEGWESSQEKKWMESLKASAIERSPDYQAAEWSLD